MKKFEVGKTYKTVSICNSECVISITVIARTTATITVQMRDEVKRLRINKTWTEHRQAETVLPWGNYSMCPAISAED